MNELDLFAAAVNFTDPEERASFLDKECAGQPALRQRIDRLVATQFQSMRLHDNPPGPGHIKSCDGPAITPNANYPGEAAGIIDGCQSLLKHDLQPETPHYDNRRFQLGISEEAVRN